MKKIWYNKFASNKSFPAFLDPMKKKRSSESARPVKYYLYIAGHSIGSLRRVDLETDSIILERWDPESRKWVFSPETLGISGFASDADNYWEIPKLLAEIFMEKEAVN